ncbi:Nramp family divalent metal transporter [Dongia soli]|uniref:Nramp family divalent metal transporter n=1 Tax=Dongia soli TaxID=600628 RepID=A0ABU5EC12_9PROT|nr:Nramp family divalent metal transporter [Dongia soli]MDY0883902.1 Nramp family divalent metal transporter [Dongia soli]
MTELVIQTLRSTTRNLTGRAGLSQLLRRLLAFAGPGWMIAVGYMDPGNWATDIAAGSAFGYKLLFIVVLASLAGMLFQALSARLGLVSGLDLAEASRHRFPPSVNYALWLLAEIGIIASDVAEIVGTAIALKLLFGVPLLAGVAASLGLTVLMLSLERHGLRFLEVAIALLVLAVIGCLVFEVLLARPDWLAIAGGLMPDRTILAMPGATILAAGIIGATVMPHNLYLHGALVKRHRPAEGNSANAILKAVTADSNFALIGAFTVNAAILILAAATFYATGQGDIAGLADAQALLEPILGPAAAIVFALALLIAGQNSTVTATLAGQVVMEGFTAFRLSPALRRLITRAIAIVPAAAITAIGGEHGAESLLVFSQVVLSLQLPFAVIPLVLFTADRRIMGNLPAPHWMTMGGAILSLGLIAANATLLYSLV